ncbi:uncharacterized protein LOC141621944 [Silene latifolia]|uniref:uncharacterized protein LOC141621944 n=1 Tax=Silene latifolia TaxID=37657 RepID=UPI003D786A0E
MPGNEILNPPDSNTSNAPHFTYVQVENPGANITQTIFNGNNYDEWSRDFHLALVAKGKEGFVDVTVTKPTTGNIDSWRSQNALVTAWIFNSIDYSLRNSISRRPDAKQVWLDIRSRFFQNNDARIFRLQADLMACRQQSNESIMNYYGRLVKLWDDLQEADPLASCPCNPCTCTWVSIIDERRERQRVREFLMGLDDKYDNARSQLLAISPLPNLNIIYNCLLQEESMRAFNTKITAQPETMAYAARVQSHHRKQGEGVTPKDHDNLTPMTLDHGVLHAFVTAIFILVAFAIPESGLIIGAIGQEIVYTSTKRYDMNCSARC